MSLQTRKAREASQGDALVEHNSRALDAGDEALRNLVRQAHLLEGFNDGCYGQRRQRARDQGA